METLQKVQVKKCVPQLRFPEFEGEWEIKKLANWNLKVIDGDRGTNYPNGDDFSGEGYCLFLNAKNVTKNGFSFETKMFITKDKDELLRKGKLKRNDLILTTRGSVGNIAFYDNTIKFENIRINSGMVLIRNENSIIDSQFIYSSFFTPKLKRIIETISFGSAQPQLTVKEINLFKLSIPTLPEQQKIASFLSAIDEKIQLLNRKKEALEQYKKGAMQQLFSQQLRFKADDGNDFPDWDEKRLGEVAVFFKGKGISKSDIDEEGLIPCIRYGELYTNYSETISLIKSRTNLDSKNLFFSKENDVIIPASGETQIDIATASCVMLENIALGGDINVIRSSINGVFLSYYLNNSKKNEIANLAQGASVMHLYSSQLKLLNLNIPSLPEQQKIAAFLSGIDDKLAATNQQINNIQTFKKGLLQQLFV